MTTLNYKPGALVDDLEVGDCVMRPATTQDGGARFWHLWFRFVRVTDGAEQNACVPMNPGGAYNESGPGGKTWGLTNVVPGLWQVAPSINVLSSGAPHPGEHPTEVSVWHETPEIAGVPVDEPWATGAAP